MVWCAKGNKATLTNYRRKALAFFRLRLVLKKWRPFGHLRWQLSILDASACGFKRTVVTTVCVPKVIVVTFVDSPLSIFIGYRNLLPDFNPHVFGHMNFISVREEQIEYVFYYNECNSLAKGRCGIRTHAPRSDLTHFECVPLSRAWVIFPNVMINFLSID